MAISRKPKRFPPEYYVDGILNHDRVILSQSITLAESHLPSDQELSSLVLDKLIPHSGNSIRIGITGVPGVGKSTFIEALGTKLTEEGKRLAVLAIDPSSQRSGGSILGDKTRMVALAHNPNAYIRPSAAGRALGGVGFKTREAIIFCEAAGFDVIFVETVGVGQSETMVHGMVDFFLLLMLAGAGDELQGIKKGIMEMADTIVINKADGENEKMAKRAKVEYQNALHLFPPAENGWYPKVLTCSSLQKNGLDDVWQLIESYKTEMEQNGFFIKNRQEQNVNWMFDAVKFHLEQRFYSYKSIQKAATELKREVEAGVKAPIRAALELLRLYDIK